jgi:putative transposase
VQTPALSYRQHRYPAEIIAHCVRLYDRFPLSHRGVEELMFERGVLVSYESIRRWCLKFGPAIAAELCRRRPQPKGKWHLDEMRITMHGRVYGLWRAVDADGVVLDILVREHRNTEAAEAFLGHLVARYPEEPRVATSWAAMARRSGSCSRRRSTASTKVSTTGRRTRTSRRANGNGRCASSSHRNKPSGSWSRSGRYGTTSVPVGNRLAAGCYRALLSERFATWQEATGLAA